MHTAQGEIYIRKVKALPDGLVPHEDVNAKGQPIISHSESGHHHVLERPVKVQRKADTRPGLDVFYAILDEANGLVQDAQVPHDPHHFEAGDIVEFRISREFDPFTQQARRVAD